MGFEKDVCKRCGRKFSHRTNCWFDGDVEPGQMKDPSARTGKTLKPTGDKCE